MGSLGFVEKVKAELGVRARHRQIVPGNGGYAVRESGEDYGVENGGKNELLSVENAYLWKENASGKDT